MKSLSSFLDKSIERLQTIVAWALLATFLGVVLEVILPQENSEGTIGLVPLYLGYPVGGLGFAWILYRRFGPLVGLNSLLGAVGILYFMGAYVTPNANQGFVGGFFHAISCLYLPMPYRLSSLAWLSAGIFGYPVIVALGSNLYNEFVMFGLAAGISGLYLLRHTEGDDVD